jgi:hypothetical protein
LTPGPELENKIGTSRQHLTVVSDASDHHQGVAGPAAEPGYTEADIGSESFLHVMYPAPTTAKRL